MNASNWQIFITRFKAVGTSAGIEDISHLPSRAEDGSADRSVSR